MSEQGGSAYRLRVRLSDFVQVCGRTRSAMLGTMCCEIVEIAPTQKPQGKVPFTLPCSLRLD